MDQNRPSSSPSHDTQTNRNIPAVSDLKSLPNPQDTWRASPMLGSDFLARPASQQDTCRVTPQASGDLKVRLADPQEACRVISPGVDVTTGCGPDAYAAHPQAHDSKSRSASPEVSRVNPQARDSKGRSASPQTCRTWQTDSKGRSASPQSASRVSSRSGDLKGKHVRQDSGRARPLSPSSESKARQASPARDPKAPIPSDFVIDPARRFPGTVQLFFRHNGYGFIDLDELGAVPGDRVFVYWKGINSQDRFPSLSKDMKVSFSLEKVENGGQVTLRAVNVSLPDGSPIHVQDDSDSKKSFVGGQDARYTGILKFFIPKRGYGYIQLDPVEDVDLPDQIRAELAEMNAGGKQPKYMKDVPVEFGIWQTQKGVFKAHNVTYVGGRQLDSDHA